MASHLQIEHHQRYMFFMLDCVINKLDIDFVNYIKRLVYNTRCRVFSAPPYAYVNKHSYMNENFICFTYQNVNFKSYSMIHRIEERIPVNAFKK